MGEANWPNRLQAAKENIVMGRMELAVSTLTGHGTPLQPGGRCTTLVWLPVATLTRAFRAMPSTCLGIGLRRFLSLTFLDQSQPYDPADQQAWRTQRCSPCEKGRPTGGRRARARRSKQDTPPRSSHGNHVTRRRTHGMSSSPAPREKLAGGEGSEMRPPPLLALAAVITGSRNGRPRCPAASRPAPAQWCCAVALIARCGLFVHSVDLQGAARKQVCWWGGDPKLPYVRMN
ncbi:hypothetical protein HPB51_020131 [Rhipicephalus microplus]|uniref:Uncharacterized protein n=1 Tax=Rhipicephalus microplus TaxID=6941 RepID=A0A9J6EIE3_RHIMP|nr:hypothetical protein HPB51_020131 [Rhipicephalus microplus]